MSILAQLKVLIVDDTSTSRMLIRDALGDGETDMRYSQAKIRPVPAAEFELGQLR